MLDIQKPLMMEEKYAKVSSHTTIFNVLGILCALCEIFTSHWALNSASTSGDNLVFSKISLATVLVEAMLLILTTTIILVIVIRHIRMSKKTHKNSPSSQYDKLWVHTNQNSLRVSSNACRQKNKGITGITGNKRDDRNMKLTQSPQCSEKRKETENIKSLENAVFQSLTFASKQQEQEIELRQNENAPSETFVDVETVSLGNGEGLYDFTGQIPMETTAKSKAEKRCKLKQMVQLSEIHIEDACHGTSERAETPDSENEDTMTQTCEEGAVAQDREHDEMVKMKPDNVESVDDVIAMNCKIKKPRNIGDVVVNQLATGKESSSKVQDIEAYAVSNAVPAYAVSTVPASKVRHVEPYAVSAVPALSNIAKKTGADDKDAVVSKK